MSGGHVTSTRPRTRDRPRPTAAVRRRRAQAPRRQARPGAPPAGDEGARRALRDAHVLRPVHRGDLRRRPASRCCSSATRRPTTCSATRPPCRSRSTSCCRWCARSPAGRTSRAGRRRPAVRVLPVLARAGARHVGAVHEGGRRARGQARGRRHRGAAGRGDRRRGHPGDGAHRLHPAERARPRRLPRAGPRRRRRRPGPRTRSRSQRGRRLRVVLEMVPADVAKRVTDELSIPTIGIGAGVDCDGQVLVWQDMAGLRGPARCRGSSSSTPTCAPRCPRRPRRSPPTWPTWPYPAEEHTFHYARRAAGGDPLRAAWADGLRTGPGPARPAGRQRLGAAHPRVRGDAAPVDDAGWPAARRARRTRSPGTSPRTSTTSRDSPAVPELSPTLVRWAPPPEAPPHLSVDDGAARGRPQGRDRVRRRTRRRTGTAARTRRRCTTCRRNDPVHRRR